MTGRTLRIDFVSDVVCPWCLIGLANLERALASLGDEVPVELVFHPLQLNPGLPPEGELAADNIARKYGITPEQARSRGGGVRAAAEAAGVSMAGRPDRLYDTFDAHRLLHWAGREGRQLALKHALLRAYFDQGRAICDHQVLADAAAGAGLDRETALQGRSWVGSRVALVAEHRLVPASQPGRLLSSQGNRCPRGQLMSREETQRPGPGARGDPDPECEYFRLRRPYRPCRSVSALPL